MQQERAGDEGAQRLQGIIGRTMDLVEEILDDGDQFRRHLVKSRSDGETELEEVVFRKVDTKALKEFVSGLKELKSIMGQAQEQREELRVVFEAGEDAFNE